MNKRFSLFFASSALCLAGIPSGMSAQEKPNVLFICIDDFRPELSALGSEAKTPNMDRLASQGTAFYNHYAAVPTSGASRYCMLTGKFPVTRADLDNGASQARLSNAPEGELPETMFHHLRRNGYYTVGIGKISHSADGRLYGYGSEVSDKFELPYSFDEMLFDAGKWKTGWNAFFSFSGGKSRTSEKSLVKPYQCVDNGEELPDMLTAKLAVNKLKELSEKKQPFCLAVGFFKPHLPFVSPKKYWDMYDEDKVSISPVPEIPEGCGLASLMNSSEFKSYRLGEEKPALDKRVSDDFARRIRHAYLSCVSYTDDQVGKVLDALDDLGLSDNTVVVLWGDHGWQLGDYRVWGKHTVHDIALNCALVVKAPGCKKGVKSRRVVSSIDIYPTLMELCGVKCPECVEGRSFVPLLKKPNTKKWEDVALGFWLTRASARTPEYRLIFDDIDPQGPIVELYKYDKDNFERKNIAKDHPEIVEKMKSLLKDRYDAIKDARKH